MIAGFGKDAHLRESLGLYLLGALPTDQGSAVESHLASCDRCSAEADELGMAASALALLSEQDIRDVIAEFEPTARQPIASTGGRPAPAPRPARDRPSGSHPPGRFTHPSRWRCEWAAG